MTLSVTAFCQNYTLPSILFDSLSFEVVKGRSCDSVRVAQAFELQKKGSELLQVNARLDLSKKEVKTLEGLLENSKAKNQVDAQQFNLDKDKLKRKLRKRNMIIFIESIGIGLIFLL